MSDVKPVDTQWLWDGRIPRGKVTTLAGDAGLGKSFLTLDIAARVSSGRPWPDSPDKPGVVGSALLFQFEDGLEDTVRNRLDAMGGDCSRITAVTATVSSGPENVSERSVDLTVDLDLLEHKIQELGDCSLVVVDPITAYSGGTNANDNGEVRKLMSGLAGVAARTGVAVVVVAHLNKGEGAAIQRVAGATSLVAVSRVAHSILKDPDDPDRRLMLPIKNNLAPNRGGLAYRIVGLDKKRAMVVWENGAVTQSADEILQAQRITPGPKPDVRLAAEEWLRTRLADGAVPSVEIIAEAEKQGFSPSTLGRAKEQVGVDSRKEGSAWVWRLPEPDSAGEVPGAEVNVTPPQGPQVTQDMSLSE